MRSAMGFIRLLLVTVSLAAVIRGLRIGFSARNRLSRGSAIAAAEDEIGGVYEYQSDDGSPPPELAALFGLKADKKSAEGQSGNVKSKATSSTDTSGGKVYDSSAATGALKKRKDPAYKSEKERRLEKRERRENKEINRGSASAPVKKDTVDTLELELLSKYGANEYREVLEAGWEDDEDDDDHSKGGNKKRDSGRFEGFNPPSASKSESEKRQIRAQAEMSEEKFFKGLKTMHKGDSKQSGDVLALDSEEEEQHEDEDDDEEERISIGGKLKRASDSDDYDLEELWDGEGEGEVDMEGQWESRGRGDADNEDDDMTVSAWLDRSRASSSSTPKASSSPFTRTGEGGHAERRQKEEEVRSGPLNAVRGYRLRKPTPLSAEQQAQVDKKNAKAEARLAAQKEKRRQKRLQEKSEYVPFDFESFAQQFLGAEAAAEAEGQAKGQAEAEAEEKADDVFGRGGATFECLGVDNPQVLANLEAMHVLVPTQIQEAAIPLMMGGRDTLLQAQTGSGKTLAFLLPLLKTVSPEVGKVQALILAPSRELVMQITEVGQALFKDSGYRVEAVIGGANVKGQVQRLRDHRPQIIVATPGRLAELVFRLRKLRLGMVRAVVVDEADNMLEDVYAGEVTALLESTPLFKRPALTSQQREEEEGEEEQEEQEEERGHGHNRRMVCLVSATANPELTRGFAERFCRDPVSGESTLVPVRVAQASPLPRSITHGLLSTPRMRALESLRRFLNSKPTVEKALIFVNEPRRVEVIAEQLLEMGYVAAPLHGETSKEDRKEIVARLKDGRLRLVVTTELAARGLDIPNLTHVINFELPTDAQHYVHRAGRCGRAGQPGLVMNFATPSTKHVVRRFGKRLGTKVRDCEVREGRVHLKRYS